MITGRRGAAVAMLVCTLKGAFALSKNLAVPRGKY